MVKKYLTFAVIVGVVVAADQLAKALIVRHVPLHHVIAVIDGCLNLTHIHNPGGAFGLMAGLDPAVRGFLFLFVSALALGLILYFYHTAPANRPWLSAGFAMIFGGAVGNLIDRLRQGTVVDFLDVYVGRWHWPAFNIADSAITVGVGIFVLHVLFKKTTG